MSDPFKTNAKWQLALPKDPATSDKLHLVVQHQDRKLGMTYSESERDLAAALLDFAKSLLPRCHLEYEAHKGSHEIEGDLDKLFGDDA